MVARNTRARSGSTRKVRPTAKSRSTTRSAKPAKSTKKPSSPAKARNTAATKNCWTKSEILGSIAETTGLTKKQVGEVFTNLEDIIARHLKKGAVGEFTLPGIAKFVTKRKPATKARKGINPFTGEETVFKAKPARNVVKIRALKKTKEMV